MTSGKSPDRLAHVLGIAGFILGLVSIAWQVFLYRESSAERVTVRLSALHAVKRSEDVEGSTFKEEYLSIEVINIGQRALYLHQVAMNIPCGQGVGSRAWVFYGYKIPGFDRAKLEPGASKTFQMKWDFATYPLGIRGRTTPDFCVTVESTKGQILRSATEISIDAYTAPK